MAKERVFGFAFQQRDGKFYPHPGVEVGKVNPDGSIEGTPYSFDNREICGGIAITENHQLVWDGTTLVNPATGERFLPTKKNTGFWSPLTRTFFKPFLGSYDDE